METIKVMFQTTKQTTISPSISRARVSKATCCVCPCCASSPVSEALLTLSCAERAAASCASLNDETNGGRWLRPPQNLGKMLESHVETPRTLRKNGTELLFDHGNKEKMLGEA